MIRSTILEPEYNAHFPYETFPWRLEVNKDHHNVKGIALTVCHFQCEEHLQKYIERYKLKPKDYIVSNRYGKSFKSSKKHKTDVPKRPRASNHGSSGTISKRKTSVDTTGNTARNAKGKKCIKKSKTKN